MPSKSSRANPLLDISGRGASSNATSRFDRLKTEIDLSDFGFADDDDVSRPTTVFMPDASRTILAENSSPDIPFRFSINPYRGCEHGCAYCYARPTHEYLGLSAGLDFETKIFVKECAPELLREKLMSRSWQPQQIVMSGVTDCYQPVERRFELTRRCLETFAEFRNPVAIITKNSLVMRDLDILKDLASDGCALVFLSITTLDPTLARALEPRTSAPSARLRAIEALAAADVPVGVNIAPVIPGLTDHEMPAILKAAANAGAKFAGYTPLRLPLSTLPIFTEWLEREQPSRKDKILAAIRDIRGGLLNDANFGSRMRGSGARADQIGATFDLFCRRHHLNRGEVQLSTANFRRPGSQLDLFDV